ncbi:MAG: hypothetical protein D6776_12175 [Planctomycetota bacterium]|nr:MAG: hypothetical protein D6776_12175 [Planctomycetota bacterium]
MTTAPSRRGRTDAYTGHRQRVRIANLHARQGALLLADPAALHNPFFRLAPRWSLYPLVGLATAATIIASQAVISGVFSLTSQAVNLGYAPRLRIEHTSEHEIGQVYVGSINWALMLGTCLLVLGFETSSRLAGAYGVAVSTTMVITTLLAFVVTRRLWHWSLWRAGLVTLGFLVIDLAFASMNLAKINDGGWVPLLIGGTVYLIFSTWRRGREVLRVRLRRTTPPLERFLRSLDEHPPVRVPGTALYLTGNPNGTPPALAHNLRHNHVLHERVLLVTVRFVNVPFVAESDRLHLTELRPTIHRVEMHFGFREEPDVPRLLERLRSAHPELGIDVEQASYFLGREHLIPSADRGMPRWRDALFAFLSRNASEATAYFHIPPDRVVELGVRLVL